MKIHHLLLTFLMGGCYADFDYYDKKVHVAPHQMSVQDLRNGCISRCMRGKIAGQFGSVTEQSYYGQCVADCN